MPWKERLLMGLNPCHFVPIKIRISPHGKRFSVSKSKYFDGTVFSIFAYMNQQYLSSWGHSRLVITNKKV